MKLIARSLVLIQFFLFIHLCISANSILASENILTAEEQAWLTENASNITIGIHEVPPFIYTNKPSADKTVYQGISIDYLRLLEKKLHTTFKLVYAKTWESVYAQGTKGDIDVLLAAQANAEREAFFNFTPSYYDTNYRILVKTGTPIPTDLKDLAGKRIGIQANSGAYAYYHKLYPELYFVQIPEHLSVITKLIAGEVDVSLAPVPVTAFYISTENIKGIEFGPIIDFHIHLSMAVSKKNPLLISILNKGLAEITVKEKAAIEKKWGYSTPSILSNKYFLPVMIAIGLVLLLFMVWVKILFNQIAKTKIAEAKLLKRNKELSVLYDMYNETSKSLELDVVLEQALIVIGNQMELESLNIFILEENHYLVMRASNNPQEGIRNYRQTTIFEEDSSIARTFRSKKHTQLRIEDYSQDLKFKKFMIDKGYKILGSYPLISQNESIGVLNFGSKREALLNEDEQQLIFAICQQLATVVLNVQLYTSLSHELVERKNAEAEINHIFEISLEMLCYASFDGYYLKLSPIWSKSLGWSEEELKAQPLYSLVHPDDYEATVLIMSNLGNGENIVGYENRYLCKDGSYKWLEWNAFSDMDRGIAIASARDITSYKQSESMLRNAIEKAEIAERTKTEFITNMSHEIRTPMNAVIGFSQLLSELITDEKQKGYINSIHTAGNSLLKLINDILDMSKMEAGMLELQLVPLQTNMFFNDIQQIFEQALEDKQLSLQLAVADDLPEIVLVDESRLRQVLLNLVGNAVKFTDTGFIKLTITKETQHLDNMDQLNLIITVEDTGIGIPVEDQTSVFEAFKQQSGQNNRKYGGTGLGLSISKKLVQIMNGEITLSSEPGVGSKFTVVLYNVAIAKTTSNPISRKQLDLKNVQFEMAKVLIVDDVMLNRFLVQEILADTGLEIILAENGQEAVQIALSQQPDLIFMDIKMPVMDGTEATILLRNNAKTKEIPIIALTASITFAADSNKYRHIFDGFLSKPISFENMIITLAKYLDLK